MTLLRFFATCARGLESVLADELAALGALEVATSRGGVGFSGDRAILYRANLYLRTAIRVLQPILEAEVHTPDELYEAVRTLDWAERMTPEHTLAVDCNVRDSAITHSQYAARRVKDAICDQFREKLGRRPSVDVETPMVGLNLHIHANRAVLSLESSGESLHKRGYRPIQTRAPLNEALAAGIIQLAGWKGGEPLIDPMCGSGTFCIEGAWMAMNRPPGLTRKRFGFMGWMDYDVRLWTDIRDQARRETHSRVDHPIRGSDVRRDAVAFARDNARAAGLGHLLSFEVRDVRDFRPPPGPPGMLICNPPYGERIGDEKELHPLYRDLGRLFRERCAGWRLVMFGGNPRLERSLEMEPARQLPLFNGPLRCRLLEYRGG